MNLRNLQTYSINSEFYKKFYISIPKKNNSEKSEKSERSGKSEKSGKSGKSETTYSSLFWAFYSLINNTHEVLEQNKFKIKNNFSLKFVEQINKEKSFLKQNKLKFHDIESNILYDKDINLSTLKCLVLLNKINLVYVCNNKYYLIESNDDDNYFYISKSQLTWKCDQNLKKSELVNGILANKLLMENIRTCLKSLSSYKVDDLIKMATILSIPINNKSGKRKTKQQLYEEINIKID